MTFISPALMVILAFVFSSASATLVTRQEPAPSSVEGLPAPARPDARGGNTSDSPVTEISIPAIKMSAKVTRLGLNLDRTVQVPKRWDTVGWYTGNPPPGKPGAAVMIGHRDSKTGPAAFYRVPTLRQGDVVIVKRADNSIVRFRITRVVSFEKNRFPTHAVYGKTARPALRLVTCGGTFDRRAGYSQNVVAFATLEKEARNERS